MSKKIKNLDLLKIIDSGVGHIDLEKYDKSIESYKEIKAKEPGPSQYYLSALNLFLSGKYNEIKAIFTERPDYIDSLETKGLWILTQFLLKDEIKYESLFPLEPPIGFRDAVIKKVVEVYSNIYLNLDLKDRDEILHLNLYELKEVLPEIIIHYSDFILQNYLKEKYEQAFLIINDKSLFEKLETDNLKAQRHRLLSLYKRLHNHEKEAEEELDKYREAFSYGSEGFVINPISNKIGFKDKDALENWTTVLDECSEIQNRIIMNLGIHEDTCGYFECSDCCEKTFPSMSLTEYLHLKKWLEKNNYDMEALKERAEKIQSDYAEKFGGRLEVVDKKLAQNNLRGSENPNDFKFSCPFLVDKRCTCHPARPLMCRGFGLSTDNGMSVKACNYYYEQLKHNGGEQKDRDIYDLRQAKALVKASDEYITKNKAGEAKQLKGTLVAWFTETPEFLD